MRKVKAVKKDAGGDEKLIIKFAWPKEQGNLSIGTKWLVSICRLFRDPTVPIGQPLNRDKITTVYMIPMCPLSDFHCPYFML